MGPKAVVGQQTYEAPPSNSDVAGLSGGIRAAGPRAIKQGKNTEDVIIISTTLFECIGPEAEHVHDLVICNKTIASDMRVTTVCAVQFTPSLLFYQHSTWSCCARCIGPHRGL